MSLTFQHACNFLKSRTESWWQTFGTTWKGEENAWESISKLLFFAQYPLFWKFAFTVCAKEFISYQKYLITSQTFSAFGGDRMNMEKLIFVSHFCLWKIIKSFPSIVNFFLLFSILRIDPFYIFEAMMYLCVCTIYGTHCTLFNRLFFQWPLICSEKWISKWGFF